MLDRKQSKNVYHPNELTVISLLFIGQVPFRQRQSSVKNADFCGTLTLAHFADGTRPTILKIIFYDPTSFSLFCSSKIQNLGISVRNLSYQDKKA
jgi:hypothetical protein